MAAVTGAASGRRFLRERVAGVCETPSWREFLAVGGLLLAVAAAAFGWYVLHGGFYSDDWGNAAGYQLANAPRYWNAVRSAEADLGGRPVLAALLPLPHALFGLHLGLHLAFGVALVLATSLSFYAVLRALGLQWIDAAAIAVLSLLFPWADAIELWPTASMNTVAVLFFFVGLVLALRGLARRGRAGGVLHAAAAGFYLLSVLTYEVAGAAAILAGILYLRRAPLRVAVCRWAADVVVVLGGLIFSLSRTEGVRHVGSLHQRIADVPEMTRQALSLLASAFVPVGNVGHVLRPLVLLSIALFFVVLAVRAVRCPSGGSWVFFATGCAVAIAAAYFMFLGSFLHPLDPGTGSRTNVFARFAYAGLVYALVAAAAQTATRSQRAARPVALAVVCVIAAGYSVHLARDESAWVRASHLQGKVLAAIDADFPRLEPRTTLAVFGSPAAVSPAAPVFLATWDLTGAVQIERREATLQAEPIYERVMVLCRARRVVIRLPGSRGTATARYGKLFFLDVPTRRTARITGVRSCRRALGRFRPGPYFAT